LNVDLEVHSGEDLSPLAAEFEARACVLHFERSPGANFLVVEREDEPSGPGLEATVTDLCNLVESLSPRARTLWDRADLRVLDAGFDAAPGSPLALFSIPSSILRRVVAIEARLAVTVYPEDIAEAGFRGPDAVPR
jgi:hypothetical protein